MKNISKEDFILWDTVNNEPLENHDTVYHYTTIVEIINTDGFKLSKGQELRCVAELSKGWQKIISGAIEQTKKQLNNMKTIAEQLNIKEFPFEITDKNGCIIYFENLDKRWYKQEFDSNSNIIYFENSNGFIKGSRPQDWEGKVVEVDTFKSSN